MNLTWNKDWRQACTDSLRDFTVNVRGLHILALTSMSVRDLPLLYDKMGGFLKMVFTAKADFVFCPSLA